MRTVYELDKNKIATGRSRQITNREGRTFDWIVAEVQPPYAISQWTGAEWAELAEYPVEPAPIPALDVLEVDQWTIPADGVTYSVLTYTSDALVNFVVDGVVTPVQPVDYVATLEIAASAAGAIQVQVRDKQIAIVAEAV